MRVGPETNRRARVRLANRADNFQLAARNIKNLDVLPSQGANVYDILRSDTLVLTKDAIDNLVERLK